MKTAMGVSIHTGWAVCVVVRGSIDEPSFLAKERIEIDASPQRFVFHLAAEGKPGEAARTISRAQSAAERVATRALASIVERTAVKLCVLLAREEEAGELADILGSHPRLHIAEACFYRDVLRHGAEANGMRVRLLPPKEIEARATAVLGVRDLAAKLAAAGRVAGRPWGKDEKHASLAAWIALA